MRRRLWLNLVLNLLLAPALILVGVSIALGAVEFSPKRPAAGDPIFVTITAGGPPCVMTVAHELQGQEIIIRLTVYASARNCTADPMPKMDPPRSLLWSVTDQIGPLPEGRYFLKVVIGESVLEETALVVESKRKQTPP